MTDAAGIAAFFTADHRACDASWASVEAAVEAGDDAVALAAWTAFDGSLRRHLDMEEQVLFPAIVADGGPVDLLELQDVGRAVAISHDRSHGGSSGSARETVSSGTLGAWGAGPGTGRTL